MSLDFVSFHISDEEANQGHSSLDVFDEIFAKKFVNLTPRDRKKFGRQARRYQPWRQPILQYMEQVPELTPYYLDEEEFRNDIKNLEHLTAYRGKLLSLLEGVEDTAVLLRKDIHQKAKSYYDHVKVAARNDVPGSTTILQHLEKLFSIKKKRKKNPSASLRDRR